MRESLSEAFRLSRRAPERESAPDSSAPALTAPAETETEEALRFRVGSITETPEESRITEAPEREAPEPTVREESGTPDRSEGRLTVKPLRERLTEVPAETSAIAPSPVTL